ncbi:MAG: hypothetical protein GY864_01110, partial [Desulfobacterales bacterium]|nr:hypothetical protein [Desulfobacterales bacterium]
ELDLYVLIATEFVESGDYKVVLQKPVAGSGGFKFVVGEDLEREMKTVIEFVLPLFGILFKSQGITPNTVLENQKNFKKIIKRD